MNAQVKIHENNVRPFIQSTQNKSTLNFDQLCPIKPKQIVPTIESIATGTPNNIVQQSDAAKVVANLPTLEQNRCRIEKLYSNTQIETRRLAVNLLSEEAIALNQHGTIQSRMQMYQEYAVPLAEQVTRKALSSAAAKIDNTVGSKTIEDSIRLIVFVSSTGFVAPGVDAALIENLGLRRDIARVTVSFMGCAAAMNGLRVACDHVRGNPTHKALVVCLELSSVNAVFADDINDVIIHSIFGDGCAAVVVGACAEDQAIAQGKVFIRDHLSYLAENTQDGIVLGIRNNGITCQLSRQLPDYIENCVGSIVEGFLANHKLTKESIDLWAVHPGGTRIIEKAQRSLGLSDSQVADSWAILRQYGNMLSPSVLFVIERMLLRCEQNSTENMKPLTGIAFSFSPGIGVEGILFQKA
ncbi:type III polyketide synthase [Gloeocapsopsis dulcis]|uniref:Naringenin-chalcone synthase n=1 Tax=Gloeocapsopsis dulcis AAB1 = 1H9 TaxID=1433147 RepID=A0A6N8FVT3_9CHRO|nr:naringenin-chalcone synthase [Gloeocapsopsis dulcis]MUL37183.1 naringenin-chalcone synthase [Gloeocapsopsis dulcis AAB1 = 1H9]WNN90210.1 naringenin-chalcone synthase [Gloeocapsopsis dulcis]